ncbi:serine/threonine protein kinase [Calothrix sp. NIES-4071]|nr:serine/threonine protein kinase [Calothrix sp. NIES-4071]BAZ55780.1 serine/threonine protein kinase [Calothrix sp. NIES-4105]
MSSPNNNANSIFNQTSKFPDFSQSGYIVESVLGYNLTGGITYKAKTVSQEQSVVIKQFQFATVGASWSGFDAMEREVNLLQHLEHPRIPKYIDCFETDTGFCLVQQYINARSLAAWMYTPLLPLKRPSLQQAPVQEILSLSLLDYVEEVATGVLSILVYLQQQAPSVIHRDIKPENILVDDQLNVYLVDFGLAQIGGELNGASTMVKGTLGFMPPEQMFGRSLTNASDLYSLGITLICLLTQTPSSQVGNLIDDSFRFKIHQLLPELNIHWIDWLEKMVAPNVEQRFPDAATALSVLLKINTISPVDSSKSQQKYPLAFTIALSALSIGFLSAMSLHTLEPKPLPFAVPIEEPPIKPKSFKKHDWIKRFRRAHECNNCYYRTTDLREQDLRNLYFENIDSDALPSVTKYKASIKHNRLRGTKHHVHH